MASDTGIASRRLSFNANRAEGAAVSCVRTGNLIHQRLRRFLNSREELLQALSNDDTVALKSETAVAAAKDLAAQWRISR